MSPRVGAFVVLVATTAVAWGCSDDKASRGVSRPGTTTEYPPVTLPSTCEVPALPAVTGTAQVVGDGTAASCTNEALQAAASRGGSITFNCGNESVVIPIMKTISVEADAMIDGAGRISLDGGGQTRILMANNQVALAVRGLTFKRGSALGDAELASGGAIRGGWRGSLDIRESVFIDNAAGTAGEQGGGAVYTPSRTTMTIVGCTFQGNRGGIGGAVHNLLSGLTIVDSVFVNNESTTDGGGAVYTDGASEVTDDAIGGTITICGCSFRGNIGRNQGGAAYLFAYSPDRVIVNQSLFEDNQVLSTNDSGALGGGLRIGNAQLDLGQSLFVSNHSDGHGGALWVDGKYPSYITNVSFVNNDAGLPGSDSGGYGGAISGANLVMTNLTFDGNWAVDGGGAIFNEDTTSSLTNSIVARSRADNKWGIKQACRNPMAGSRNLQWPDPGSDVVCTAETTFADPLLGELRDNGGATNSEALGSGSPAFDAGTQCPALDQRGEPRTATCDLGAYEG